jgi:hypothetical protein
VLALDDIGLVDSVGLVAFGQEDGRVLGGGFGGIGDFGT